MKFPLLVPLLLAVSGCNSVNKEAADQIIVSGDASIQRSQDYKGSGFYPKKHMFGVARIDGNVPSDPNHLRVYSLSPGTHQITAVAVAFEGHTGHYDTKIGQAVVTLEALAKHKYEIRGSTSDNSFSIFIFDLTANVTATAEVQTDAVRKESKDVPLQISIPIL
jgi:hypothetical protein